MKERSPASSAGGFLVSKIHQISGRVFARLLKEAEGISINPAQGRIMFALWRQDGLSIGELSKATALEPSTLTSMLDRLEATSLIRRENDPSDRRVVVIRRGEADRALEERYRAVSERMNGIYYRGLSEEETAVFETTLEKILENLEEAERELKA